MKLIKKVNYTENIITNETKKIEFIVKYLSGFSYKDSVVCTVKELKELLEKYNENDYIQFTGSDDTNSDYSPYTDSRGISILNLVEWSEEDYKNFENEQKEKEKELKLREEQKRIQKEKEEFEQYQKLKLKYENNTSN